MTTAFVSAFSGVLRHGNPNRVAASSIYNVNRFSLSQRRRRQPQQHFTRFYCSAAAADAGPEAAAEAVRTDNIMVFSATYCPYCSRVKALFSDLGVKHTVWEVDTMTNGDAIRTWLLQTTGQRTIPNVFIRGQHIGGCDDTFALYDDGKLMKLIQG